MKFNIMALKLVIKSIKSRAKSKANTPIIISNTRAPMKRLIRRRRRQVSINDPVKVTTRPLHRRSKNVMKIHRCQKAIRRNRQKPNLSMLTMALKSITRWELVLPMH